MRVADLAVALTLGLAAETALAQTTPAPASGPGDFAGTWTLGGEVMARNGGGYYYVHGVASAKHIGGGAYTISIVAVEPHWKPGEVIQPFSARQKCTGQQTGTALSISCTVTTGTPGYYPDEFKLDRTNSSSWGGSMAIGNTGRRMKVNFYKI